MPDYEPSNLITELRRGSLTLGVLGCLKQAHYGYALLKNMQQQGIQIEANTLYPLLRRLESQGLLQSDWDTSQSRPRKYYTLSVRGQTAYRELVTEWQKLQSSLNTICQREEESHE